MSTRSFSALALTLLISTQALLAQPPDEQDDDLPRIPDTRVLGRPDPFPSTALDDETLLSPDRSQTIAGQVGSSVSVINESQMTDSRQSSVSDILRGVPGVDVSRQGGLDVVQQGGAGRLTSVFIRGANSQHTKVLLDGIPMNDPSNATRQFDFGNLLADNIERIEVLRGPQSMMYGSDAIGGVINIITKRGDGPTTARLTAMGGSFGTSQESFQASGGGERAYFSIGGSYLDTSGISVGDSAFGNIEDDRYQNGTISARFGWTPTEELNIDYVFRYIDSNTAADDFNFGGFPPVIDNFIRTNTSQALYNRVQIQSLLMEGSFDQTVGFSLTNYVRKDINGPPFLDAAFNGQTRQFDWQGNLLLTENNTFTAGVDYWQEDASSSSEPQQSQNNAGVYVQDRMRLWDDVAVSGGVRWDDNSGAGPATTYRATAIWDIRQSGTLLHSSIGTGFRAPSLAEKFFAFGNPALRPEKSQGWDVGVERQLFDGGMWFDVTYFDNDFTDLVVFDPFTFTLLNIGRARASGVEVSSSFVLTDNTSLTANYTFTDTRDETTGMRLARRPVHKMNFGIYHEFPDERSRANLYFLYAGDRLDSPFSGVILDSYITVNVSGSYDLTDRCELFARIDNLFDEQYQEVFGFGTPGISGYAGISVSR